MDPASTLETVSPPVAFFAEAGVSARDAPVAGLGLRRPWRWQRSAGRGHLSGATELAINRWSAPSSSRAPSSVPELTTQLTLMPMVRWQGDASLWFIEGGIGLSFHDREDLVGVPHQSTRWNFQDVVAVGRYLAPAHEWSLRLTHISNAGLRKPNPGEDRLTLRWSAAF